MKQYNIYYDDVVQILPDELQKRVIEDLRKNNYSVRSIGSCQAWIISTPYIDILQSYNTLVCAIDNYCNIFCSGTYSATTRSHIGKFADNYNLCYYDFKDTFEKGGYKNIA